MARELKQYQLVERSITKKYRHELWNAFVQGVKEYNLVEKDDIICVNLDGSAQSILIAKLFQHLMRISEIPFTLVFKGNGDYSDMNIDVVENADESTKQTSNECFSDVIEHTMNSILEKGKTEGILPMEGNVIRPLFCIKREHIAAFVRYNALEFPVTPSTHESTSILLSNLEKENKGIQHSIFKSIHSLSLDTMVRYESDGITHNYLDNY